ncbi:MAG: NAD(P)-dependent oxidoreductase, partial [Planctomycetota bacterium]
MPERRPRIVLAEAFDAPAVEKLRAVGEVFVLDACDEAHLKEAVADCDAILINTSRGGVVDSLALADALAAGTLAGAAAHALSVAGKRPRFGSTRRYDSEDQDTRPS